MPVQNGEGLQVLRYKMDQKYDAVRLKDEEVDWIDFL
jgi:hypothetical protein